MGPVVVKLGSSIVVDERGEPRLDVLGGGLRRASRAAARRPRAGDRHERRDRQGDGRSRDAAAPSRDRGATGGERGRAGQALPGVRRALARARCAERAGAADVLRHERAQPLRERPPDAPQAARLASRPGNQRERHDDHRRDLVRQQRLPRRPGSDPARRRAAGAADRRWRSVHGRPATRPERDARAGSERLRRARGAGHRPRHLADRVGRDALQGRRRRDGDRRRDSRR